MGRRLHRGTLRRDEGGLIFKGLDAACKCAVGQARQQSVACGKLRRRANQRAVRREDQRIAAIEHGQRRQRMQPGIESAERGRGRGKEAIERAVEPGAQVGQMLTSAG